MEISFVPHAVNIVWGAVVLGLLAIAAWRELRSCTCKDKPKLLRPKWKRHDPKDWVK